MSSSPVVKVVVKAANGSMGDFRVDASHQWRIQELKKHLYRHYPTHPVSLGPSSEFMFLDIHEIRLHNSFSVVV